MWRQTRSHGLTLLEVIAGALAVVLLGLGLWFWLQPVRTRGHPRMTNSTQLRGIHQGMVTYSQDNKVSTTDGFFPGLDASGQLHTDPIEPGETTFGSGGTHGGFPQYRYALMLNKAYFTPEYMVTPKDRGTKSLVVPGQDVTSANYSYAFLQLDTDERRGEWAETINSQAIVAGDRLLGSVTRPESIWTEPGSGQWEGTVVSNDGSTNFISEVDDTGNMPPVATNTRYSQQSLNEKDHLFIAEGDADAAMVYATDDVAEYAP